MNDQMTIERVTDEYLERLRRGENPSESEYVRKHPELAEEIRELFPAILFAERMGRAGPPAATASVSNGVPEFLGEFRLVREIGRGGMGVVYEAVQESLGRHVALKVLPLAALINPTYRERFEREARAAARLHHTNIVPVFGVGEHAGIHFIVMQYIGGQGLDAVLNEVRRQRGRDRTTIGADPTPVANPIARHPSPGATSTNGSDKHSADSSGLLRRTDAQYFQSIARIGVQVGDALAYAHRQGVQHRDIKPSNLLLDAAGTVWVTDFGLAKSDDDGGLTQTGDFVGTLRYMAPERFRGESDARSDVYGLGVTLFELLTLRPAFVETDRARLIEAVARHEPPPLRQLDRRIPRDLETIVTKAMAKEPRQRYASAELLTDDLKQFLADRPIRARRTPAAEKMLRWCRRNPKLAGLTGMVAALLMVIVIGSPILLARLWDQRQRAVEELWVAQLARAEAKRATDQAGRRFDGIRSLDAARGLLPTLGDDPLRTLQLRNQFIASMSLADLGVAKRWQGYPRGCAGVAFESRLERYARSNLHGDISIRRVEDDAELSVLPGNGEAAWLMKFSPNGRFLAAGYQPKHQNDPNRIVIWDCEAIKPVIEVPSTAFCRESSFSADSRFVAFGTDNATLAIHDLTTTGSPARQLKLKTATNSVVFHPDGKQLAIAQGSNAEVRDIATGNVIETRAHAAAIAGMAFRRDGRMLAVGTASTITLWEAGRVQPAATLAGHEEMVLEVAFSGSGDLLASKAHDSTVRLWDVNTRRQLVRTSNVFTGCSQLQFDASDQRLGFASDGTQLWIWDVAHGKECRFLEPRQSANWQAFDGSFSPDGRFVASGGRDGARLWDWTSGHEVAFLPLPDVCSVLWSADGKTFFTTSRIGLHRWPVTVDGGAGQWVVGPPTKLAADYLTGVATIAGSTLNVISRVRNSNAAIVRGGNAASDVALGEHAQLYTLAASPDGRHVATGSLHGSLVKIWDAGTGKLIRDLPIPTSATVAFSPDGLWLVIGTDDEFTFWDATNWQRGRAIPKQHESIPRPVSFASDGVLMSLQFAPTVIRLVNANTFEDVAEFQTANGQTIKWHRLSPDGCRLAVGIEGGIRVWDLSSIRKQLANRGLDWSPSCAAPATTPAGTPSKVRAVFDSEGYERMGDHHMFWRDFNTAANDYRQALVVEPNRHSSAIALASLLVLGPKSLRDADAALSLATKAVDALPDNAAYRRTLGAVYFRLTRHQEALTILEPISRDDAATLFVCSMCAHHLGKDANARDALARAFALPAPAAGTPAWRNERIASLRAEAERLLLQLP